MVEGEAGGRRGLPEPEREEDGEGGGEGVEAAAALGSSRCWGELRGWLVFQPAPSAEPLPPPLSRGDLFLPPSMSSSRS